jgi:hypothetical protein
LKNKDWQIDAVKLANSGVMSWREIAEYLKVPKSTVSDYLRVYFDAIEVEPPREIVEYVAPKYDNSRILFISDMHIPYHHKNLLPFLSMLKDRYEPTRIIGLGDELDKHAMSFHDSDPDLPSAGDELRRSLPVIAEVESLYPVIEWVDSNHGSLAYRKAKHHGIPRHYIRGYNEVLQVGSGWSWHNDLVLDMTNFQLPDVYVHHGKSNKAIRTSQAMSMSHVCGHFHESFGIEYWANPQGLYFGMNSGCLIDDDQLAFAYNNANLKRPIIGTSLIIDGVPVLEAMPL